MSCRGESVVAMPASPSAGQLSHTYRDGPGFLASEPRRITCSLQRQERAVGEKRELEESCSRVSCSDGSTFYLVELLCPLQCADLIEHREAHGRACHASGTEAHEESIAQWCDFRKEQTSILCLGSVSFPAHRQRA